MALGDVVRDSPVAKAMFATRYGEEDPYLLALQNARRLGYPMPGETNDVGEAQRYESSNLAAKRFGVGLPLVTNPLHEALLSWFAEGEGHPSLKRLQAGYRGAFDQLRNESQPLISAVLARFGR